MDTQPLIPTSSSPFSGPPTPGRRSPMLIILVAVLGLGTIGFGAATVAFAGKASKAASNADQRVAAAAKQAKEEQKKASERAAEQANQLPFRTYTAPEKYGSFVISFPKNWSSYFEERGSGTQVYLILNPEFIKKIDGQDEKVAAKVQFIERTKDAYLRPLAAKIQKGTLKQTDTKVSGLPAYNLTGAFDDRKTTRQVIVPVRDKVLVFSTENATYMKEFEEILSQAKIIP